MVVVVGLTGKVVHNCITLDVDCGSAILHDDRRAVQVDTVVDNKQRVVVVDHIIVDTDTIQVLLKEVLEEEIFLLKSRFLLLNGKLVKMGLVETLIEVVELFELIVNLLIDTKNFLDLLVRLLLSIRVALVEG